MDEQIDKPTDEPTDDPTDEPTDEPTDKAILGVGYQAVQKEKERN